MLSGRSTSGEVREVSTDDSGRVIISPDGTLVTSSLPNGVVDNFAVNWTLPADTSTIFSSPAYVGGMFAPFCVIFKLSGTVGGASTITLQACQSNSADLNDWVDTGVTQNISSGTAFIMNVSDYFPWIRLKRTATVAGASVTLNAYACGKEG